MREALRLPPAQDLYHGILTAGEQRYILFVALRARNQRTKSRRIKTSPENDGRPPLVRKIATQRNAGSGRSAMAKDTRYATRGSTQNAPAKSSIKECGIRICE